MSHEAVSIPFPKTFIGLASPAAIAAYMAVAVSADLEEARRVFEISSDEPLDEALFHLVEVLHIVTRNEAER